MNKICQDDAWADYLYWQKQDKKLLKRINQILNILVLFVKQINNFLKNFNSMYLF